MRCTTHHSHGQQRKTVVPLKNVFDSIEIYRVINSLRVEEGIEHNHSAFVRTSERYTWINARMPQMYTFDSLPLCSIGKKERRKWIDWHIQFFHAAQTTDVRTNGWIKRVRARACVLNSFLDATVIGNQQVRRLLELLEIYCLFLCHSINAITGLLCATNVCPSGNRMWAGTISCWAPSNRQRDCIDDISTTLFTGHKIGWLLCAKSYMPNCRLPILFIWFLDVYP